MCQSSVKVGVKERHRRGRGKKSLLLPQFNQQKINFNMLKHNKSLHVLNMCIKRVYHISNAQKVGLLCVITPM